MAYLTQKYIVEDDIEQASPLLPQHIVLTDADGNKLLGELQKLGTDATTVAAVKTAYNTLIDALVAAGLASTPAGE